MKGPNVLMLGVILMSIVLISTLASKDIYAQSLSDKGSFSLNAIEGCRPFTIQTTFLNGCPASDCTIGVDYGDGSRSGEDPTVSVFEHTFDTLGTFEVIYFYSKVFSFGKSDTLTIRVVDNIQPQFDIFTCSNNEVTIDILDNNYDNYIIDFDNDGIDEDTIRRGGAILPHNYGTPGNFNISVRGLNDEAADNCNEFTQPVTALAVLPPTFINSLIVLGRNQIQIDFNPQEAIRYRLEVAVNNDNNFFFLQDIPSNVSSFTVNNTNLDFESNVYCFRIASFDPCNVSSIYSNTICTVIPSLQIVTDENRLTWNTLGGDIVNFDVERDGGPFASTPNTFFNDQDIVCNTIYRYNVIANYSNGGMTATSTSLARSGTAFSSEVPASINDISIQVNGRSINVLWNEPNGFTTTSFDVDRKSQGINAQFLPLTSINATTLTDNDLNTSSESHCYRIDYIDDCGNAADEGITACSILLQTEVTNTTDITLVWNAYEGWSTGVSDYIVDVIDRNGTTLQSIPVGITTSFVFTDVNPNEQVLSFRIRAVANDITLAESISNINTVTRSANIIFPNAFTPNGDNVNDRFNIVGRFIQQYELKVFNRWGQLLFMTNQTADENGWDGTFEGQQVQAGVYTFTARIVDLAGNEIFKSGPVVLSRN